MQKTLLPRVTDTMQIVFTPDEEKTYNISFLIVKDTLTDIITIVKVVTGQSPIWKSASDSVTICEGMTLEHSFAPYLADSSLSNVTFKTSSGTITNTQELIKMCMLLL